MPPMIAPFLNKFVSTARSIQLRLDGRNFLTLVKLLEISILKERASTYCYNFPSHIMLELTSKCNLRCVWCQQSDREWRKQNWATMDMEDAKNILPDLKGAKVLLLYDIGEPLLYKGLPDLIREARKYIPQVRITTNGTLLTKKKSIQLEESGLTQLNVSIDSPNPEQFYRVRLTSLEKISDNLRIFCDQTEIPLQIWSVISTENIDSLKMLPDYARQFENCEMLYFNLVNSFDLTEKAGIDMALTKDVFEDFRNIILKKCKKFGLRTNLEYAGYYPEGFVEKKAEGICNFLTTSSVTVNTKGAIVPCCAYRDLSLESVSEEGGFSRAWNGPQVRAWRRRMFNQEYGNYCQDWCGYSNKGNLQDVDDLDFKSN